MQKQDLKPRLTAGQFTELLTNWRRERLTEFFEITGLTLIDMMKRHRDSKYKDLDEEIDDTVTLKYHSSTKPNKENYTIIYTQF